MSLGVRTPVQIAWVTRDLNATEVALTGLPGAGKWVRMPEVNFAPDACSYLVAGISLSYLVPPSGWGERRR